MSLMNKKFSCRQALALICFLLIIQISHSKVSVNPRDRSNGRLQESMNDKRGGKSSFKSIQSSLAITSSSPPKSSIQSSRSRVERRSEVLILLLPWLYFMAISINIPNLPKFVNWSINSGNTNVSPKSAAVYGTISGVDSFFTFLVVNVVGCMSDSFGRRPFMFLSSLGLGFAYFLTLSAKTPGMFYFAAMIDGLTSCMFSQAQCYVTDMNNRRESADKESVSVALGRFQGIAVGMAFLVGIPLGAVLGSKYSLTTPLYLAVILCSINAILIAFFLPEKKNFDVEVESTKKNTATTTTTTTTAAAPTPTNKNKHENKDRNIVQHYVHDLKRKMKRVKWENASPIGAVRLLTRKKRLVAGSMAYFFLNVAQVSVQINWINYLQFRFGWSAAKSGSTLMLVGFAVAVLPQLFNRALGKLNAISFCLMLHAVSIIALGTARSEVTVYVSMAFFSAGACALPMVLGFLTDEVSSDEVGALQGAADTVRTISSVIAAPLMSRVFAGCIDSTGGKVPQPQLALYASSVFSLVAFAIFKVL